MIRLNRILVFVRLAAALVAAFLFCAEARAVGVDATDISGRSYGQAVLQEINGARQEIYAAMFAMYVRYGEADNPAYELVDALVKARERGVYVRVYLNFDKGNDAAYRMLREAGAEVYFIKRALRMHSKLVVIDGVTVVDGSTNWTQKALWENVESAQVLKGVDFARVKLDLMGELEKCVAPAPKPRKRELLEKVRIRNVFLEDKRFGPRMVTDGDGHSFDMYLYLLREFKRGRKANIRIDYVAAAGDLGIVVETVHSSYRSDIRRFVQTLKEKYGLVDYCIDEKGNLDVRLLDYDDAGKEYVTPKQGYFNVPLAFWVYDLDRELMLREKFAYLVAIYEQEIAAPRLWWQKGLKGLSIKYDIDESTFAWGLRELKKLDLIEVRHSRVNVAGGEKYEDREPNEYRLKELVVPAEKAAMWRDLERREGVEAVRQAREFAKMIDEGNSVQAAKDFVRIVREYGHENVREAVGEVAKLQADNPVRNIGYVVGVLKRMRGEGR